MSVAEPARGYAWRAGIYGKIFTIGLQNTVVYRWNFFLRVLVSFVPLIGSLFLWQAVFDDAGSATVGGYTFRLMAAYYIAMVVMDAVFTPVDDDFRIAADIRDGLINQMLTKPLDFMAYRFTLFVAARVMYTAVTLLPLGVLLWFLRAYFEEAPLATSTLPAVLAMAGSALLQFAMAFALAMLAFWLLEIASLIFVFYGLESIAGGRVFPLDLLPAPLDHLAMALPFAYEYYFPIGVLLGRIQGADIWWGLAAQAAWTVFFFALGQWLWRKGLHKYTAVGG